MSVLCLALNPVLDTSLFIDEFRPVYRTDGRRISYETGGKGTNVVRGLAALGHPARLLITLGGGFGRMTAEAVGAEMAALGTLPPVVVPVSGETRLQLTVIDQHGEQRAFYAPAPPFSPEDAEAVRQAVPAALAGSSGLCLSGSSPGPQADSLFPEILSLAAKQRVPTLLDTYGAALPLGLAARPAIVKCNRAEAEGWLGMPIAGVETELGAVRALLAAGAGWGVLTLGAAGALFACGHGAWRATPPPVPAINPIGSGDAMSAGLMAGLLRGYAPPEVFRLGMAAAAANTLTWEAGYFSPDDVEALLSRVEVARLD